MTDAKRESVSMERLRAGGSETLEQYVMTRTRIGDLVQLEYLALKAEIERLRALLPSNRFRYPTDRSHSMKPFATFTIKVFDDKDQESEIDWSAVANPGQRDKLIEALEANLSILKRERAALET